MADIQLSLDTLLSNTNFYQAYTSRMGKGLRNLVTTMRPSFANISITSSSATTIATGALYVKAAGTTALTGSDAHQFTMPANNKLLYGGVSPVNVTVTGSISIDPSAAGIENMAVKVKKNTTLIDESEAIASCAIAGTVALPIHANLQMIEDDFIEIWIANITSTDNITATLMSLSIRTDII